jgi:hypothetical protein
MNRRFKATYFAMPVSYISKGFCEIGACPIKLFTATINKGGKLVILSQLVTEDWYTQAHLLTTLQF